MKLPFNVGRENKNFIIMKVNGMQEPKEFTVIYKNSKGENVFRETNDENTAFNWEVKYNGTTYKDNRYKAKLRLYYYLLKKKMYA